jgi:voltage-gated potassium channel Kch
MRVISVDDRHRNAKGKQFSRGLPAGTPNARRLFPTWLRIVFRWIPDVAFVLWLVLMWRIFARGYIIAPSAYSLVEVSLATLGWVLCYTGVRYWQQAVVRLTHLWKVYWVLIFVALSMALLVRREMAARVLESSYFSVPYAIGIACLVGAGFVAVASMLRSRANLLRLGGFLLVQALLVFSFAQPYLYGDFASPSEVIQDSSFALSEALAEGREETIRFLFDLQPGQLRRAVAYLRENSPSIPAWFFKAPSLTLVVSGLCERAYLGPALYLSTITWTTVGFGDLIPTAETRATAAVESILGYLFMAALAAVLIRWMQRPNGRTNMEGKNEPV